jgi:hypothetical protein
MMTGKSIQLQDTRTTQSGTGRGVVSVILVAILCLVVGATSPTWAGNKKMVEDRTRELDTLNKKAVEQLPDLPENGQVELEAVGTYKGEDVEFEVINHQITAGSEDKIPERAGSESVEQATPVKEKKIDFGAANKKKISGGEAKEDATENN